MCSSPVGGAMFVDAVFPSASAHFAPARPLLVSSRLSSLVCVRSQAGLKNTALRRHASPFLMSVELLSNRCRALVGLSVAHM